MTSIIGIKMLNKNHHNICREQGDLLFHFKAELLNLLKEKLE